MSIGTFDTHSLLGVIQHIPPVNTFWLDLCFTGQYEFDTEFIDFDIVDRGRRLAPFVSPMAQGKPMLQVGYTTRRFKPAYIKPKDNVDPRRLIKRTPGEAIGMGSLSMEARRNAVIADILRTHRDSILRRIEWMAARAIIDDQVVVSGEDYPSQTISFGRAANQTLALLSTDAWSDVAKLDPLDDLEDWSIRMFRASGYSPTKCVMGLDAWAALRGKQQFKDAINLFNRGTQSSIEIANASGESVQYRGMLGALELWTYCEIYQDNAQATVDMMDSKSLVLVNPSGVQGARCFGAIMDPKAGYRPAAMWPTNFVLDDPAAEFVMTQSAPLAVPLQPNAAMRVKVCT